MASSAKTFHTTTLRLRELAGMSSAPALVLVLRSPIGKKHYSRKRKILIATTKDQRLVHSLGCLSSKCMGSGSIYSSPLFGMLPSSSCFCPSYRHCLLCTIICKAIPSKTTKTALRCTSQEPPSAITNTQQWQAAMWINCPDSISWSMWLLISLAVRYSWDFIYFGRRKATE